MGSMLTVRPHGTFTSGFDLVDPGRGTVGALAGSAWREGGWVRVGPQQFQLRRTGGRRFVLTGPAGEVATAARASFWTASWRVVLGPRELELVRPSLWSSRYELRDGGQVAGWLRRRGVFRVRPEVTLPADLPPPFQVFVVAVVMAQWRRESSSAAAAGGASAAVVTTT